MYLMVYHEAHTKLTQKLNKALIEIMVNDQYNHEENTIFQQDESLEETFPGGRIRRRGAIEWLVRSPNLSPIVFFSGDI